MKILASENFVIYSIKGTPLLRNIIMSEGVFYQLLSIGYFPPKWVNGGLGIVKGPPALPTIYYMTSNLNESEGHNV